MSKRSSKIYLSKNGNKYSFISYFLEDADGSFYIIFQREGEDSFSMDISHSGLEKRKKVKLEERFRKRKSRISYHSSGCVRYHFNKDPSNYFEPLNNITKPNVIGGALMPSLDCLDGYIGKINKEDYVVEIDPEEEDGLFQCTFIIAPPAFTPDLAHIAITYENSFSFIIQLASPDPEVLKLVGSNHADFTYMTPSKGLFEKQKIDKHAALIGYHQNKFKLDNNFNPDEIIMYPPNRKGICKIVYVVPMRIPPKLKIKFFDPRLSFEIIGIPSVSVFSYRVIDQFGQTVKEPVMIKSIALDSRFRS